MLEDDRNGVLGLYRCENPQRWQENEIGLAMMVAAQAVLAISQTHAYEQVRALAQRESLINTITAAIRSSLEPQAIFTAITQQLGQALDVDGCALSLWTKEDLFVRCVGLYDRHQFANLNPATTTETIALPQSIVPIAKNPVLQQVIETAKPVVVGDMEVYPEMNQFDLPLRASARALLIVPLIVDREIIGSISLRQTDRSRHWSNADLELAQAVASQAAIAVQQSRLYETTKQQAERLLKSEQRVKQLNKYLTESVLKRFLPAAIVTKVAAGELLLDLSPEPRLVTILFTDLVGFTPLASKLGARRVAQLLNEYLEVITKTVFEQGGTVDKFIGDAVVALFGAPEEVSPQEQVRRAVNAARGMHRTLEHLNQQWQAKGILGGNAPPPLQFRCGINQGSAVVGMFGNGQRSDYTAIGLAVNLAQRLQEVADPNTILVSATVASYLESGEILQDKSFKLKGIEEKVTASLISIHSKL
jgi:class 3 adenylate cyclase